MVLDFGASWCPGCRKFEKVTFADHAVSAELDRFVAVHPDLESADEELMDSLKASYGVVGLPTVIIYDSTGRELKRYEDFEPPIPFLAAFQTAH